MDFKRVTLFTGHYGSGKTSLAVAWSKYLRAEGKAVAVYDLDIVNPYFRTADHRRELEEDGISLIASQFAGSNVDLPSLPAELYAAVEDRHTCAVLDIGGDDRGAVALGRYVPSILDEDDYEMLFVVNFFRPLTRTPEHALGVLREVETACGMRATALVNNSNLGAETAARDVLDTQKKMDALAGLCGLPVKMTSAARRLADALEGKAENLFYMDG